MRTLPLMFIVSLSCAQSKQREPASSAQQSPMRAETNESAKRGAPLEVAPVSVLARVSFHDKSQSLALPSVVEISSVGNVTLDGIVTGRVSTKRFETESGEKISLLEDGQLNGEWTSKVQYRLENNRLLANGIELMRLEGKSVIWGKIEGTTPTIQFEKSLGAEQEALLVVSTLVILSLESTLIRDAVLGAVLGAPPSQPRFMFAERATSGTTAKSRSIVEFAGGNLTRGIRDRIKSKYVSGLQRCHTKALKAAPDTSLTLNLAFVVSKTGRVNDAKVTGRHVSLAACIKAQALRWRFAEPHLTGNEQGLSYDVAISLSPVSE